MPIVSLSFLVFPETYLHLKQHIKFNRLCYTSGWLLLVLQALFHKKVIPKELFTFNWKETIVIFSWTTLIIYALFLENF